MKSSAYFFGAFAYFDFVAWATCSLIYSCSLGSFTTLDNPNSDYDQNKALETGGDDILDWGEGNPFGEYGNFTGSF